MRAAAQVASPGGRALYTDSACSVECLTGREARRGLNERHLQMAERRKGLQYFLGDAMRIFMKVYKPVFQ